MPRKFNILLAEDDLNLGALLVDFLKGEGYDVKLCQDGEIALQVFKANTFDLCLLDVMMPKIDGFSLAKMIKERQSELPIIFITAKSLKNDKLKGYNLGADDYITKPFDEEELLWKIKAILRRTAFNHLEPVAEIINIGNFLFDFQNQSLIHNGVIKRTTEKESEILKYLFENRDRIIRREIMLQDLWGENDYFLGRSLDVFISKIRKYLKEDPDLSIENIFGVGFIFNVKSN